MLRSSGGQCSSGSYRNLQALLDDTGGGTDLTGGGPLSFSAAFTRNSRASIDSNDHKKQAKCAPGASAFHRLCQSACEWATWHGVLLARSSSARLLKCPVPTQIHPCVKSFAHSGDKAGRGGRMGV